MLSVFSFCVFLCQVECLLPFFAVLLFLGSLFEKIFGSELLFLGVGVGLVFFGGVLHRFLLYVLTVRSRNYLEKFSWCQVCCFWVRSLFLRFFRRRRFCFCFCLCFLLREKAQVVTGHPHTHLCLLFLFSFLSRRTWFIARFGRAPCFLVVFRGAILGPARFWDSPGTHGAWARSPLLRPLFGREAASVFLGFLSLVVVFPFCLFCGFTQFY